MPVMTVLPIFWGTSWATPPFTNAFTGDKITGLTEFYSKLSSKYLPNNYTNTCNEYTGYSYSMKTIQKVTSSITFAPVYVDRPASPLGASIGSSASPVLAEVCKVIKARSISTTALANYYFPVYADVKRFANTVTTVALSLYNRDPLSVLLLSSRRPTPLTFTCVDLFN